jgi:integrase
MSKAKRAASKRGETIDKKTAATQEPLEAMVATCDDSLEGIRDKALLLFAWASGGRRRSEVAAATVEQLTKVDDRGYLFRLTRSKTDQDGSRQKNGPIEKPVRGAAAEAFRSWLSASKVSKGPIFRRLWKTTIGPPLSPAAIADVVRRRARLAGLEGDWAGHSLRSGFVTEAGKRNIPLGDVMAMTEHRKVDTVLGYYRTGELSRNLVGDLLSD